MGYVIDFLLLVGEEPKDGDATVLRNGNHCGSRREQTACGGA
ncbi:hypothetical protein ACFYM5_10625 [Streptomyces sp. NPDC006706]